MTFNPLSSLTGPMSSTPAMLEAFSARACVQGMLDFEAALSRAEIRAGVIPTEVGAIGAACDAARIDFEKLGNAAASAGNLAIPLVKQLTALVAAGDKEAAKYVHWGATSQDVIDTGLVLQLRHALDLIDADLEQLAAALAALALRHRDTPMVGRTWMQHALPITFGLKAAGWLDGVMRHQERLTALRSRVLVLQFGGAAGTLASLGAQGMQVSEALAEELQLALPDMPWHTQRDRVTEVAAALGMLAGSLGKMARDISLCMQTDVAELAEPAGEGRGGSSTMPHKRNPVGSAVALTAAVRVPALVSVMLSGMVQEHERALGGWQAEWDTLPEIFQLTAGALQQMTQVASGLAVDAARMRKNLDATGGQIMAEAVTLALGAKIGRMAAHQLVEKACHRASQSGQHLREVLLSDSAISAELSAQDIDRLLDPSAYLGQAGAFVDRVLQSRQRHNGRESGSER
ncbi:3-carboxy-cis,cis-muconate cycloisomerase [Noviherbaspirillum cavernae]|uniref:3-carboxy-cis,cis-muconate cycloisomerase n=1 Tax=Noviherbaspirillum cavernae TaxID=2320862 RepID=A0A418X2N3_9BURK|nr:3-carboxy-cis,cis-muconate cycloisomerase [Noviherbaspirillum cavernae]RJG06690.1 3-carboxy-cis,cis-muconate cycloisomerase [Noviherbaspirillum cavernae]